MPDIIDASGLQVKSLNEIIADLETNFRKIYGDDINIDQNSPDGQALRIFAQASRDLRELIQQINAGFNPDNAVGRILDERVALNSIARAGGTYTIVPITIVTDRTVTLAGLDAAFNDAFGTGYTVQDGDGNKFILIDTVTLTAGTNVVNFRAESIGAVQTVVGTINIPVTIVLGVTSVNNASAAIQVGANEETDTELRTRRRQSVALGSSGYLNGILGTLLNLSGVTDAKVYENITSSVDSNGIPAHGIWAIVEGGANSDIADIIYKKKSAGADMKGDTAINITTSSGAIFTAKFDRPTAADLRIRFDIQPTKANAVFNQADIKQAIIDASDYSIGQFSETSLVTAQALKAIQDNGGGGVPVNVELSSDGSTWVDYIDTPTLDAQWVVDSTRITITVL